MEDDLSTNIPAPTESTASDTGASSAATPATPAAPQPSAAESFLDTLTETSSVQAGQPRDPSGRFAPRTEPAAAPNSAPAAQPGAQPGADPAAVKPTDAKAPDQEDAELLAGMSERGRARFQQLTTRAKEAEGNLTAIRDVVASAGLNAQTFGQHLEFARLVNSSDPRELQQAAQMIEQARSQIYKRLGQDAPTFDPLADHADLQQAVATQQMTRPVALEVMRMRENAAQSDAMRQAQVQQEQQAHEFQEAVKSAQASLESYVASRAHEVDHPARMQAVQAHFSDPAKVQELATNYRPEQWPMVIRMLYDNVRIAPVPRPAGGSPLSSRPAAAGSPTASANQSPMDRMASVMESMGI